MDDAPLEIALFWGGHGCGPVRRGSVADDLTRARIIEGLALWLEPNERRLSVKSLKQLRKSVS